jgi:hypothetical protein
MEDFFLKNSIRDLTDLTALNNFNTNATKEVLLIPFRSRF